MRSGAVNELAGTHHIPLPSDGAPHLRPLRPLRLLSTSAWGTRPLPTMEVWTLVPVRPPPAPERVPWQLGERQLARQDGVALYDRCER